jgi:hypothetical protein
MLATTEAAPPALAAAPATSASPARRARLARDPRVVLSSASSALASLSAMVSSSSAVSAFVFGFFTFFTFFFFLKVAISADVKKSVPSLDTWTKTTHKEGMQSGDISESAVLSNDKLLRGSRCFCALHCIGCG